MAASAPAVRPALPVVLWQSVRPMSLTVALLSAMVGTFALLPSDQERLGVAALCALLAVLLQAATNVLNDAEDALTGADIPGTMGASLAMRQRWITPQQARLIAAGCFIAAAITGIALVLWVQKPGLLWIGAAAVFVGWAYTAPPLRLAYRPLGELASGIPMGIGIVWGTAAAQAQHVPAAVWWAGIPMALLTAAILHANNGRDRLHDKLVGKRTLATYLSPRGVVLEFRALLIALPVVIVAGLITRGLPLWCALALIPGAIAVRRALQADEQLDARGWTLLLIGSVRLHSLTGVTLCAGFLLSLAG